ncbi:MAG: flippase [Anaerolineae bacterium]|nr:flippase [Anaerolineae bacterium]
MADVNVTTTTPPQAPLSSKESSRIIARNSAFVMGSQVAIRILAFIFQVYVVRSLGSVDYGKFATVMAYLMIFSIFSDFGMAPYTVREMARDWTRSRRLISNTMFIRLVLSVAVVIVATSVAILLDYAPDIVTGVFIAGCGLFLYAFQGPLDGAVVARERLDVTARLQLVNQLIFVAVGTLMLVAGVGFIGLILATLLGVGVWGLGLWRFSRRKLGLEMGRIDPGIWRELLIGALPFGVAGLAVVLMQRFDTIVLSLAHQGLPTTLPGFNCTLCLPPSAYEFMVTGEQLVGWYAVSVNLVLMTMLLAQSVAQAMYPTLVREHARDPEAIRKPIQQAVKYLMVISLPIAVGTTVLADQIIVKLYTAEFAPSIITLRILIWAMPLMFLSEVLGRAMSVLRLERAGARRTLFAAGVVVVLNLALIPALGLLGAALSFMIGRILIVALELDLVGVGLFFSRETLGTLARVSVAAAVMGAAALWMHDRNLFLIIGVSMAIYAVGLLVTGGLRVGEALRVARMILGRSA